MHGEKPWDLPAHGFNPLDMLDPSSPTFAADALVLAEMLITRSASDGGSTRFFKNKARDHVRDFIVHCKTTEPPERQNLATIYGYMHSDPREWESLIAEMKKNPTCGYLVRAGANDLEREEAQSSQEFSGVLSTMQEDLNWLADPLVRDFMSRGDVDFSILKGLRPGQRGGVISLVLPLQYNKSHAAVSRLALACAVLTLQRPPMSKGKVLFLIDEAADLGKIAHLPDWLATLRKYNVMLWPIFQNIGQLAELYGRGWQTLVANCGVLQILGIGNDLETAQYTERLLGQCTQQTVSISAKGEHSFGQAARALMTADELRRLDEKHQIALYGNLPPIRLGKTPYWHCPALTGRFHPNPYYSGKTRPDLFASAKALWGRLYYAHVWLMAPHPIAAVFLALTLGMPVLSFLFVMIVSIAGGAAGR
jgi:type IV secretion system protein VirD4